MTKGAEAIVKKITFLGKAAILKERIKKSYRIEPLDQKLRSERTKNEARLLHKAKICGVKCPTVLVVDDFSLTLSYISGKHPNLIKKYKNKKELNQIGSLLAKLHKSDIVHGDFTPANILVEKNGEISIIDFGLGFISTDIEDKAVDVFTFLRTVKKENHSEFLKGYEEISKSLYKKITERVKEIEKRVRYAF